MPTRITKQKDHHFFDYQIVRWTEGWRVVKGVKPNTLGDEILQ